MKSIVGISRSKAEALARFLHERSTPGSRRIRAGLHHNRYHVKMKAKVMTKVVMHIVGGGDHALHVGR
jgi:hypothetical protein